MPSALGARIYHSDKGVFGYKNKPTVQYKRKLLIIQYIY